MKVVNLTPHAITVWRENQRVEIPPSGCVARVGTKESPAGSISVGNFQVPLVKREWAEVDMPTPQAVGVDNPHGVIVIVSSLVGEAIKRKLPPEWGGAIFVAPDTGATAVRDKDGKIVGVRRFILLTPQGGDEQ